MKINKGLRLNEVGKVVTGFTVTQAGVVEIDVDTEDTTTISRIEIEELRVLHHAIGIVLDFLEPERVES